MGTVDNKVIAAGLRELANFFDHPEYAAQTPPAAEPVKRGRGRPVKGEDAPPAAPVVVEADPFAATAPVPPAPVATLDDVRNALTALRSATTQEQALAVLKKAGGADNLAGLAADKYGVVVAAVNVELRIAAEAKAPAPVVDTDPFATPTPQPAAPVPAQKPLTIEEVKAEIVKAQTRTSQDTVQKLVMQHGGKAVGPNGVEGPSLKALPEANYAATIAALKALPKTK